MLRMARHHRLFKCSIFGLDHRVHPRLVCEHNIVLSETALGVNTASLSTSIEKTYCQDEIVTMLIRMFYELTGLSSATIND